MLAMVGRWFDGVLVAILGVEGDGIEFDTENWQ